MKMGQFCPVPASFQLSTSLFMGLRDLQLPREPLRSARLWQLTGRYQDEGKMRFALRSINCIDDDVLNNILYFSVKYLCNYSSCSVDPVPDLIHF